MCAVLALRAALPGLTAGFLAGFLVGFLVLGLEVEEPEDCETGALVDWPPMGATAISVASTHARHLAGPEAGIED
jgi:hypothetical protein